MIRRFFISTAKQHFMDIMIGDPDWIEAVRFMLSKLMLGSPMAPTVYFN